MSRKYHQGIFTPKFPKKYKGDVKNIVFRSGWELRVMKWLDMNTNVLEWRSEEIIIPYLSPVDGKYHRYYPDFVIRVLLPDKMVKTYMLEVKPMHQTIEPAKRRKSKKYITEVATWGVNEAKWVSAREYCADRGWEFKLITEKELGL